MGPDAKELAGAAKATAGSAAKGAKAAKTRVSDSVGADVARATAGAAKEGATKVAQAGKAGAGKVAEAGKAGIGRITGTGKKGAGKVSQAGKTAGERLKEFVSEDNEWEKTSPMTSRRKPGRSMSQRFSDLFKADDIENPQGLARWLASKYDGVPTTTKPGEKGFERIMDYLTALQDPTTQENRGKVNRTINQETGKKTKGPLRGSRKKKAPKSVKQRAQTARDNHGWKYHDASNNRFKATNKPPTHSNYRRKAGETVADKHLGPQEDVERKQDKKVARTAFGKYKDRDPKFKSKKMEKQMPNSELIHKQRQDILERLEKLV